MLSPSSSVALVKDKLLPTATDNLQSLGQSLQSIGQSLQSFSRTIERDGGKTLARTLKQARKFEKPAMARINKVVREVKPEQIRAVAKSVQKGALPFVRANPLLAVGLFAGAGLLIGLVSLGAGGSGKTVEAVAA